MAQGIPIEAIQGHGPRVMSVDPEMLKMSPPVYIFNVGPEQYSKSMGGLGTKIIPACPPGERVSKPLVVTGLYPEQQNFGEAVVQNYLRGTVLADDIIGKNSSLPTLGEFTTNLTWMGVFATMNAVPTDAEIQAAKDKRRQRNEWFVADGDRRSQIGPGENGTGGIGVNHRKALAELKLKRGWADPVVAQEECPACGSAIRANIAVCPRCTAPINMELYKKHFPAQHAAHMAAQNPGADTAEVKPVPEPGKPLFDRNKAQGR